MNNRYSRQVRFRPIGESGQQELQKKQVLVVGAGALGTNISEMLVRAGVGKLTIIDRDFVEWSNLQRQQLYTEKDAQEAVPKATAAAAHLRKINSSVEIEGIAGEFNPNYSEDLFRQYDLILDATDNFDTRLVINDMAQKHKIPWVYGGCTGSVGMTFTIIPNLTPCLSCLMGNLPFQAETCDTVGIIAPIVQWVTAQQVTEALKILTGANDELRMTLLFHDIWKNHSSSIKVSRLKKEDCPSCGENAVFPHLDIGNQTKSTILCGRDTVQIRPGQNSPVNFDRIKKALKEECMDVLENDFLIQANIENHRIVLFNDGRALIHGTKDPAAAKELYHQLLAK
ncbi:molybdopterin/thiamine biosynthesis adenylyltransferase [Scopulibacillus darangshiensis]|uniref:Molybdopterin/thiamine biosynthesis adenylyltransferase n=1 Tax=Scopulibacillus darangshiensis TaxID=442528 RepID=A0A4R2PDA3_9BACL|nr:ThiF family adenylyltransferase [Scopulibacillus darangshiensis]TCP32071.1 molybdopterin/thiamine biosynthesis adenylyltransferase [Scopulibacillus darangshiensis]